MTSTVQLAPLAHAGEGATWQALLTLLALGLVVVVLLVAFRVVTVEEPGDLILPLAGTAVLASLSGATSTVLSDWVGWAFPVGVVALLALLVVALSPLDLSPASPVLWATVVVAVVAGVVLRGPITRAWHPATVGLDNALLDDLAVDITQPEGSATVSAGTVELVVEASGGSLGEGFVDDGAPADPEEQVGLTITVVSVETGDSDSFEGDPVEDCTDGCTQATYEVALAEPGEWTIFIEAKAADTRAFTAPSGTSGTPTDSVTVTVE